MNSAARFMETRDQGGAETFFGKFERKLSNVERKFSACELNLSNRERHLSDAATFTEPAASASDLTPMRVTLRRQKQFETRAQGRQTASLRQRRGRQLSDASRPRPRAVPRALDL